MSDEKKEKKKKKKRDGRDDYPRRLGNREQGPDPDTLFSFSFFCGLLSVFLFFFSSNSERESPHLYLSAIEKQCALLVFCRVLYLGLAPKRPTATMPGDKPIKSARTGEGGPKLFFFFFGVAQEQCTTIKEKDTSPLDRLSH